MFFKFKFKVKNRFIFSMFEPENVILCIYNAFFKFKIASFFQCSSLKVSLYAFKICFSSSNLKSKIVSFFNVWAWKCHFFAFKMMNFLSSDSKWKSLYFFNVRAWKCHYMHLQCVFKFKFKVQIVSFCQYSSLKVSFYAFEISFSSSNSKSKIASFFQCSSLKMSFYALTMRFSSWKSLHFFNVRA